MKWSKMTLIAAPLVLGAALFAVTPARAGTLDTSIHSAVSQRDVAANAMIIKADYRYRRHRHWRHHRGPFVTFGFGYPAYGYYGYPYAYGYPGYPTVGLGIYGYYGGHHHHRYYRYRRDHREHDHR